MSEKINWRTAFRETHLNEKSQGKYTHKGPLRFLIVAIAGYVNPDTGEFFLSGKQAAWLLGHDDPRNARAYLKGLQDDDVIWQTKRGQGVPTDSGYTARASQYEVFAVVPCSKCGEVHLTFPSEMADDKIEC